MNPDAALTCKHFGRCGGCSALTTAIAEQLERKRGRAGALLQPFLHGLEIAVDPPPRTPSFDRMKLLYPAQTDSNGELQTGLYAAGSHELVPVEECAIQARALTALAQRVTDLLRACGATAYDERTGRGWLRALHARIAPGTGELILGLVTTAATLPRALAVEQIVAAGSGLPRATRAALHLVGVVQNINAQPGNVLLGPTTATLWGRDHIFDRADGLTFRIGFGSFYQVHRHAAALLYRPALRLLGEVRGQRVVDGYGGVGCFALRLAAAGAVHVDLVESSPSACGDARAAAASNGLAAKIRVVEAPFATADVPAEPDVLIVDPPRSGLGNAGTDHLLALRPHRVLYVSCSAESLARDLESIARAYDARAARLCDLFPHTDHVELLLLLTRKDVA